MGLDLQCAGAVKRTLLAHALLTGREEGKASLNLISVTTKHMLGRRESMRQGHHAGCEELGGDGPYHPAPFPSRYTP